MRALFIIIRIAAALGGIVAMVAQLIVTYNFWTSLGIQNHTALFFNFFSFFTIDSNVAAVVAFGIGAVSLIRDEGAPRWFALFRASAVTYMAVTFVVYNLLLRGIALPQGQTLGWANEVLHIIVAFPIIWVIYTLIRGPLAYDEVNRVHSWYPYPFLNPTLSAEGYWSVLLYVIMIAGAIIGTGAGVIRVSRARQRWPLPTK